MSDDTLAVVTELRKLRNRAYRDNPVSLYGGMVNLPLIVTRPDGERYFEADVRAQLTGGKYWSSSMASTAASVRPSVIFAKLHLEKTTGRDAK